MICDEAQLFKLTKRRHRDAQLRVLVALGVEHKVRPDGSIVVSEAHVERLLGGGANAKVPATHQPDFAALAETS